MRNKFLLTIVALLITVVFGCGSKNQPASPDQASNPSASASPGNPTTATNPTTAQQDQLPPGADMSANPTTSGNTPIASGNAEISMITLEFHGALNQGDKTRLEPMLADDYKRTRMDGTVVNKSQELASVKKSEDMFSMEAQPAQVNGDMATVTGKVTLRQKDKPEQSSSWQVTDKLRKTNNKWLIVSTIEKKQ